MNQKGFTLMEILAVLLIIGVLAAIGVPRYQRSVERSRADESLGRLQTVYAANRMFVINNPACAYCTGMNFVCTCGGTLVTRNYMPDLNADPNREYNYYGAGGGYVACARRRVVGGVPPAPFSCWSHRIAANGVVTSFTGNAGCAAVCP